MVNGISAYKCTICGYEYKDNFVHPQHDFEKTVVEPTCTSRGAKTGDCVCGYRLIEFIEEKENKLFKIKVEFVRSTCKGYQDTFSVIAIQESIPHSISYLNLCVI